MSCKSLAIFILSCLLVSCNSGNGTTAEKETAQKEAPKIKNQGHQLVYDMVQKIGGYDKLLAKKDVVYTYTYQTPDGKSDVSTEKYIFDKELSYGAYNKHERTFPQLEGLIEQGYDGNEYWLKHKGEVLDDEAMLKRVAFNRPTNYYWFAMMQKLLDPGLNYEYLGEKKDAGKEYDVVKVTFTSTNNKPTDIYQLYLNKKTSLVDHFLFTVADFGIMETPKLMKLQYEKVDGIMIPSKRQYRNSTWNADAVDEPWINVTWTDIKFGNGLKKQDFKK